LLSVVFVLVQCGIKSFTSSYLCITLVKIRNAALQKKRKPNLKIYLYPNSKCDLLRRDDDDECKVEIEIKKELTKANHS
jgi:hypothetical protein